MKSINNGPNDHRARQTLEESLPDSGVLQNVFMNLKPGFKYLFLNLFISGILIFSPVGSLRGTLSTGQIHPKKD